MSDSVSIEADEVQAQSRDIARDAAGSLAARVVAMVCSSVTALLVANALSAEDYGGYAIVVGINVVLVMGLDLGLTSALARYVAQGRATTKLVVTVALVRLAIITFAAGVVIAAQWVPVIADGELARLLPYLAALVVVQSVIAFHFGSLPSLRRIKLLLLVTVLQPVGELALVLVVRSQNGGAADMLLATIVSAAVVSILVWILLLIPGRGAAAASVPRLPDVATLAMVARYGRSIFLVSALLAAFGQIDQFVIGLFHPLSDVAPYALSIKIQALLAAPAITIAGIVAPRIAGSGAAALGLYRQWLVFLTVLNLGAVLVVAVLAPQVLRAIGGQYHDSWPLLVALCPFLLVSSIGPLPSITMNQTGHAASRLKIAAIALVVNAVLDVILVPGLGGYGAAIGTTIAYTYYLAHHHRLLERALREQSSSAPSMRRMCIHGSIVALAVAALAAATRLLLEQTLDEPSSLLVLLVAGGLAAVVHVAWASRIVRTQ